jgi:hypothetical protein
MESSASAIAVRLLRIWALEGSARNILYHCTDGPEAGAQYLLHVKTTTINGRLDRYTVHHSAPADMAA